MDKAQAANELKRRGVTLEDMQNYFLAVAEPIAAMGSGIIAEPVAGFAGLAAAPFGSDAAANAVNYYRDQLTYSPRTEAGQGGMAAVGEAMAPIGEAMDYAASGAGDYIYDKTGSPALAAAAYSAPTAALELLGLKGVNQLGKAGKLGQPLEFGDIGSGGVGSKQRGIFAGVKAKGADNGPMTSVSKEQALQELGRRVESAKADLDGFVGQNRSTMKTGTSEQKAAVIEQAKKLNGNLSAARMDKARADENLSIIEGLNRDGKVADIDLEVADDGAGNVKYTDRSTGGYIDVRVDSSAARNGNITGLYVPDEFRGRGVANSLLKAAMSDSPSMMGQVSSKKAAVNAYRAGRRPIDKPNATIGDVLRAIDVNSSVNMATQ